MESLLIQELQREVAADHLRMAGHRTRAERRRRDRTAALRRVVGNALISVGVRVGGNPRRPVATVAPLRRV